MIITFLNSFTIACISTVITYLILYKIFIEKLELAKKISLFVLIGWFVMLTQITMFSNTFTSAISGEVNLTPLHTITEDLLISGQFDIVKQFLLNVFMFVPFGFLFPILKQKNRSLYTIIVGLSITIVIETIQIFIGRSFDIDDIISNFIGVLLGLGYYFIVLFAKKVINKKRITIYNCFCILLTIGLTIFLIALPLYAKIIISNNTNGFFLYTHERPTDISYNTELKANSVNGTIYNTKPMIEEIMFKSSMMEIFNIDLNGINKLEDGAIVYDSEKILLVYRDDGTMDIESKNPKIPLLTSDGSANNYQMAANKYLKKIYDIDELLESSLVNLREKDNKKEIVLIVNSIINNELYFGEIYVTMDDSENLLAIHSTLVKGEAKENVSLNSPLYASKLISKTGNFNKKLEVTINTIELSYFYNQKSKTLIPTWYFKGLKNDDKSDWSANINAVKN